MARKTQAAPNLDLPTIKVPNGTVSGYVTTEGPVMVVIHIASNPEGAVFNTTEIRLTPSDAAILADEILKAIPRAYDPPLKPVRRRYARDGVFDDYKGPDNPHAR